MKAHLLSLLEKGLREDGRKLLEYREPIKVEYGVSPKSAEGSAKVTIGDTEVIAGVKLGVGEPYPDSPDEGVLIVGAEFIQMSNPKFESGPPGIQAIELARVIDRGIRESKAIDTKKLCIKKREKVWIVFLDVYPINDDGNLFDAASLAAIAALKDAKFPTFDKKEEKIDYTKRTKTSLPLKCVPIESTVIKIKDKFITDPSLEEWDNLDARLTVATLENGTICAMQKGGTKSLSMEDIEKMIEITTDNIKKLRKHLK